MQACEAESMDKMYLSEGGYSNDRNDPGGPTNRGVTIIDANKYAAEFGWIVGRKVTAEDMKVLPKWFADKVYDAKYWDALNCDALPAGLDYTIFDYGVNSGIGRSGKVLRRVLGLPDNDYRVTAQVLAEVAKRKPADLINAVNAERLHFLKSLSTWPSFGVGWGRRVASVTATSLHMAAQPVANDNRPAPHTAQDNVPKGKAVVPPPSPATKTTGAAGSATTAVVVASSGFNPLIAVAVLVGGVIVTIVVAEVLASRAQKKTEAATPGIAVVPIAISQAA